MKSEIVDIRSGEFRISAECLRAYRRGVPLDLRQSELRLLFLFLQHRNKILPRAQICASLGASDIEDERSVDVYVMRLRKGLKAGRMWDPIETVKSKGYRFRPLAKAERDVASAQDARPDDPSPQP